MGFRGLVWVRRSAVVLALAAGALVPGGLRPALAYQQCATTTTGSGARAGNCVGPNWEYGGCGTLASPAMKTSVYWCHARPLQLPDLPLAPING